VRAGLSIPLVRTILAKVRLVSKLCRKSTNFQREMSVAVDVEEAGAAVRDGRERIPAAKLVSRLIVDCPTRWGSTLAMVRRFLHVGPAVPSALSAYYHYTALSRGKVRVECPNRHELAALSEMVDFLKLVEYASTSIGAETIPTSPMEETLYWYVRQEGAPSSGDSDALSALKGTVLRDMHTRREAERRGGPNPDWFGIRVAAVLLNPFYKFSSFGNEVSTAAIARATAFAIIRWMMAKDPAAGAEDAPGLVGDVGAPSVKRRRTFEGRMRSFCAPEGAAAAGAKASGAGGAGAGRARPFGAGSLATRTLEQEWGAYLALPVDPNSDVPVLDWWRDHERFFPRVALGARYLLAIPATSVTSERVFSKAGRTIFNLRARMTGPNAEKFIVLHDEMTRRRRVERAQAARE